MQNISEEETKKFLKREEGLPKGFCLQEDKDFLYLIFQKQVAVFSSCGVDPEEVLKEAELFLQKNEVSTAGA